MEQDPQEVTCGGLKTASARPVYELLPGHPVALGGSRGITVTRTLPNRVRRMVGAWCFIDHFGPQDVTGNIGMRLPPHPHTELQTVTWLVSGEIRHLDSIGSDQVIRPGQLNLMTAGRGIAHAEVGTGDAPTVHGVQLWVALPGTDRHVQPQFSHHDDLPVFRDGGATVTVLMGELAGAESAARCYTPLVGAEAALEANARVRLPLRPDFEYALLTLTGKVDVDGTGLEPGPLLYLGSGRSEVTLEADAPGRVLLLGGEPFEERIVMWWNFVARDHDEIVAAREEWTTGSRFGTVAAFGGAKLPAPPMPTTRLTPRGRHR
ncbi:pirin family protein [Planotetraspora sp. A-T 1434]|uniref:pirin family protein n=1 Tax=Planotetraspora sp. A-T 1434 TaxID=2979219 RepID=UPI0021BE4D54|nr:pirin family protein [Planotetraspora sp. A-T 1434]MCT9928981.1 pirin family protein [Planotetraspora sp. A-T 1434]